MTTYIPNFPFQSKSRNRVPAKNTLPDKLAFSQKHYESVTVIQTYQITKKSWVTHPKGILRALVFRLYCLLITRCVRGPCEMFIQKLGFRRCLEKQDTLASHMNGYPSGLWPTITPYPIGCRRNLTCIICSRCLPRTQLIGTHVHLMIARRF